MPLFSTNVFSHTKDTELPTELRFYEPEPDVLFKDKIMRVTSDEYIFEQKHYIFTSDLEEAIDFIDTEAYYSSGTRDVKHKHYCYYAALSAMTYLNNQVYFQRLDINNMPLGSNKEQMLAFQSIFDKLHIPNRIVNIDKNDSIYYAVEVNWGNEWHFFDITKMNFFLIGNSDFDVASWEAVSNDVSHRLIEISNRIFADYLLR